MQVTSHSPQPRTETRILSSGLRPASPVLQMAVIGRPGRVIVYLVTLCLLRLYVHLWNAEALSIPRPVRVIGKLSREASFATYPAHPHIKLAHAPLPPTVETDRGHEAVLVEIPPTPVLPDEADTTQNSKRQVVISGPTSTVAAGSGAPGVQISTGDGGSSGTNNTGTSGGGGGGLTADQKLQLGLGIGIGLPGAIAGLIAIWAAVKQCCGGR